MTSRIAQLARTALALSVVAAILAVTAKPVRAGGIVLEAYTGERPADANRLLGPILDALAKREYSAGDTLARAIDGAMSRPAVAPAGLPDDFAARVDRGFKAWVGGRFDEAIRALGALVETAHANPGAFAKDQAMREPLQKALIGLALAQQRIGDPGAARATFGELLRAFPDTQLSRATYGPEAAEAYDQVRRDTLAAGRGKLTVQVPDDGAAVFVDEGFRALGTTTAELVAGEYRVCVMVQKQPTRCHTAVVRASADTTLVIDPTLDRAVHTTAWTGLAFATQSDRDGHEAGYAARVATALGAASVIVIGIADVQNHPSIVGSLISLQTGREIRRASVALDPDPSTVRLRALAGFLAGDDPSPGLDVQLGAAVATNHRDDRTASSVASDQHDGRHARWGGWKWIAGGVGVAGLAAGGVLIALDGRCGSPVVGGRPCNDEYATKTPGFVAVGGGAVVTAIAIYLFVTSPAGPAGSTVPASPPSRAAFVVPMHDGAFGGVTLTW